MHAPGNGTRPPQDCWAGGHDKRAESWVPNAEPYLLSTRPEEEAGGAARGRGQQPAGHGERLGG